MKKILFYYSLLFFLFSLTITILSLTYIDIEKNIPYIHLSFFGAFISFVPCILILKNEELKSPQQLKIIILILLLFGLYCFCNAFFNITPIERDGKFYLVNHGNQTEIIDKLKYLKTRSENFVCYSSVLMLFSGISSIVFFLSSKQNDNLKIKISS